MGSGKRGCESMREKQWKKGDLTEGPIGKQLLLFALPLLGASFIQQLYNTVDLFFVGNLLETDATAAVGASSLLTSCIVGFFTGLSVGTGYRRCTWTWGRVYEQGRSGEELPGFSY